MRYCATSSHRKCEEYFTQNKCKKHYWYEKIYDKIAVLIFTKANQSSTCMKSVPDKTIFDYWQHTILKVYSYTFSML